MKKQTFSSLIETLDKNLQKTLPGEKAHQIMEAYSAKYLTMKPTEKTRKSAVLILLYSIDDEIYFPLILRNLYNGFHSGEVGFPGGKYEEADENLIQTALREAKEEIGLNVDDVKILGTLTEIYIGPSDFNVLPVIGYIPYRPVFSPDSREVQQIFEMKLDDLKKNENISFTEIQIPNDVVLTPYYKVQNHKAWGATAKIIVELLSVLNRNVLKLEVEAR